jgi:hypothetical protein
MFRRFTTLFFLIMLLCIGQQGALTHEISHFTADLAKGNIAQENEHSNQISAIHKTPQRNVPDTHFCAKCLSYCGLVHSLNTSGFSLAVFDNSFELHQAEQKNSYLKPLLLSYAARAPPTLA